MEREYDEWNIARALLGKKSDAIIKDGYIVFREGYRNPYTDLKEDIEKKYGKKDEEIRGRGNR